jgi:L-threonylcarbamoyladenylate synthase
VPNSVEEAVSALRAGRLVVIPTDTVYGVGGRPDDSSVTARIFEAKQRLRTMTLPVLVPSLDDAMRIADLGEIGRRLAERHWPGPLTIVCRRTEESARWDLGGDSATVGVRMPAHPLALAVLERAGPLAVTSANVSGDATPATCEEIEALFADAIAVYVCDDVPLAGSPSTVVDLTTGEPRVLREGALSAEVILNLL